MSTIAPVLSDIELCDSFPGCYTRGELENLYRHVEAVPDGSTVMEIGVGMGKTASALLLLARRKHLTVYLVDNWETGKPWYDKYSAMVADHFIDVPHVLVSATSLEARKLIPRVDLSFIHIDGDHSFGGATVDCKTWLPSLRPGGVACFHDYNIFLHPESISISIENECAVILRATVNIRVKDAVEAYMKNGDWTPLEPVEKQMSFRRLK